MDPKLIANAKETFKEQIGAKYPPRLPADQKPPLELNRNLMERCRAGDTRALS